MFIRSERLFLRPSWPEDWQELLTAINDESVVRNLARAPWPYTKKDAQDFAAHAQERMLPHFFITLPSASGTKLIGGIGLALISNEVELGYWIAPNWQGNGYASEAACAVLKLASALGHNRLIAQHFSDNPASARVLIKNGFRKTGKVSKIYSAGRDACSDSIEYAIDLVPTESYQMRQAA